MFFVLDQHQKQIFSHTYAPHIFSTKSLLTWPLIEVIFHEFPHWKPSNLCTPQFGWVWIIKGGLADKEGNVVGFLPIKLLKSNWFRNMFLNSDTSSWLTISVFDLWLPGSYIITIKLAFTFPTGKSFYKLSQFQHVRHKAISSGISLFVCNHHSQRICVHFNWYDSVIYDYNMTVNFTNCLASLQNDASVELKWRSLNCCFRLHDWKLRYFQLQICG